MKITTLRGGWTVVVPDPHTTLWDQLFDVCYDPPGTNEPCEATLWSRKNTKWHKVAWFEVVDPTSKTGEKRLVPAIKFRSIDDAVAFQMRFA